MLRNRKCRLRIALSAALVLVLATPACGGGEIPPVRIEAAVSPMPTAGATGAPGPEALPISISPDVLALPAGASGRYSISILPEWSGDTPPTWSVSGLTPGVTAHFLTEWGHPAEGPLQIDTPGSLSEGTYTLEVFATVPNRTWSTQAVMEVLPCRESLETGAFTRSIATDGITHTRGGPSTLTYGIVSAPLQFCESATTRKLRVVIESATSETGALLDKPPTFVLYRFLEWPADDITHIGGYVSNVAQVAESDSGTLIWGITPGVYLLWFPEAEFIDTQDSHRFVAYPEVSVTYRVEVE